MSAARDRLDDDVDNAVIDLTVYDQPAAPSTESMVKFLRGRGGTLSQRIMQERIARRLEE